MSHKKVIVRPDPIKETAEKWATSQRSILAEAGQLHHIIGKIGLTAMYPGDAEIGSLEKEIDKTYTEIKRHEAMRSNCMRLLMAFCGNDHGEACGHISDAIKRLKT